MEWFELDTIFISNIYIPVFDTIMSIYNMMLNKKQHHWGKPKI